jgi:hypothetical protein
MSAESLNQNRWKYNLMMERYFVLSQTAIEGVNSGVLKHATVGGASVARRVA